MLVIFSIPALGLLFLQNQQVQTALGRYAAKTISGRFNTRINLSSIHFSFFNRLQIKDLSIEDHYGDTLLHSEVVKIRIRHLKPEKQRIHIKSIRLENASLNLVTDSAGVLNLAMIIDPFRNPHRPPEKKMILQINEIMLDDGHFALSRMEKRIKDTGINFTDLDLDLLSIKVSDLSFYRDTIDLKIDDLSGMEKSGFSIGSLSSSLRIGKRQLTFAESLIKTEGSDCYFPLISLLFENYGDFSSFLDRVTMHIVSEESVIKGSDLAYFANIFREYEKNFFLRGEVIGKVSDLMGRDLFIRYNGRNFLHFDFLMIGLPDIENTFLDFKFKSLNTSYREVNHILMASDIHMLNESDLWSKFGTMEYRGRFTGYPDNFVTSGYLGTDIGRMVLDLSFRPGESDQTGFHGRLQCNDLHLGELINQETHVGKLDMDIDADGTFMKNELFASLKGTLDTLEFYNYSYSNIDVDGIFQNRTFNGRFSIRDPNIMLDFEGLMDLSSEIPAYNFVADVARARPYYLNLRDDDPAYFASFLLKTNLTGKSLNELNGELTLVNSLFERTGSTLQMYNLNLIARNTPDSSLLFLKSDHLDAELTGKFKITELPQSFIRLADAYMNVDPVQVHGFDSLNHFKYRFDFKRMNPVLDFFAPKFQIGDRSTLDGNYNPPNQLISADGQFNSLTIGGITLNEMRLSLDADSRRLALDLLCDSVSSGDLTIENQKLNMVARADTALFNVSWDNRRDPLYKGELKLKGYLSYDTAGTRQVNTILSKSEMVVNNDIWILFPSFIKIRPESFSFDSLLLVSVDKYVLADGTYSKQGEDVLQVSMNDLSIQQATNFFKSPAELEGGLSGTLQFRNLDGNPYLLSDLEIEDLFINGESFGSGSVLARWDEQSGSLKIDADVTRRNLETLSIDGNYTPSGRDLNFNILLNNVNLGAFEPYASRIATDLDGFMNARLTLDGTVGRPELNGTIYFDRGTALLNYLNTVYTFNNDVRIYHNNIYLDNFEVLDRYSNMALINGTITNSYFRDLRLNLDIRATNFEVFNTTQANNELFYGNVFGSGRVNISKPGEKIKFDIRARTNRNTSFFLPLYNASEAKTIDFVTFVEQEASAAAEVNQKIKGVELAMELEVTPEADVQLIFDPQVGDIIRAAGKGNLQINLDEMGDFEMYGDVELQRGEYLFTLQNVINKRFAIEPGSKIIFNGAPTNANIDLQAIYNLKAAPYNLSQDGNDENLKKRIPVECRLNLTGELTNPTIKPGINMPTADPETRNLLDNSISTEEELMKQFLALLVINNFYSVSGYDLSSAAGFNGSVAGVTASELLSNQLSNWLSQISDDFDIGINYRPGDEVTSDEVELALSTQLLDDRIRISGNVRGTTTSPSATTANNSNIAGDFIVEFMVTDNISIKAFNRARDELLYQTAPYKQGVGISYKEEFDTLGELVRKYRDGLFRRDGKKKKSQERPEQEDQAIPAREEEEGSTEDKSLR